jgi:hypothetical protein
MELLSDGRRTIFGSGSGIGSPTLEGELERLNVSKLEEREGDVER